ncbi:MAG: RIO1 family regulatory kinase/ATPase domain-containing protein [Candidatus Thorarchaeota archaeon]|nr:MAG: hypothetical protein DRP09_15100 [Candidatus Thorarchaeota archaeon]RLI60299.1 MAG: hypothetical protein DRO87_00355 [Candidatus Thorarchaeota archaeon]
MDISKWFDNDMIGVDGTPLPHNRIKALERILDTSFPDASSAMLVSRMRSRKNIVLHLRVQSETEISDLVAKLFVLDTFRTEVDILQKSYNEGLRVPKMIGSDEGVILMDYIPGIPLVDEVNLTFDISAIEELAEWYYRFHTIHGLIKGDPRLRNFIITARGLYGVDFEEAKPGHWLLDIAGVCASLLDTEPIFDRRKRALSIHLLEKYLSFAKLEKSSEIMSEFNRTLADVLEETARWRNSTATLELSTKIREDGLSIR